MRTNNYLLVGYVLQNDKYFFLNNSFLKQFKSLESKTAELSMVCNLTSKGTSTSLQMAPQYAKMYKINITIYKIRGIKYVYKLTN